MYTLLSYVLRGKVRKAIITNLDKPMTPTDLAKKTNLHRPAISRSLIEMTNKKIIKCLTPNEKTGRLYFLTDKGKKILKEIS